MPAGLGDIREQLQGAVERQFSLARVGREAEEHLDLGQIALARILELRLLQIYDPQQSAIPDFARGVMNEADGASKRMSTGGLVLARNSQTSIVATLQGSTHDKAATAIMLAAAQVDNVGEVVTYSDTAMDKIENLNGYAGESDFQEVHGLLVAGVEATQKIAPTAVNIFNTLNDYLADQGMEPLVQL